MPVKVLIVVALESEAEGILSSGLVCSRVDAHTYVGEKYTLLVTGIGLIQAAKRLTQHLCAFAEVKYQRILNLGYAGALTADLANGQLVQIVSVLQHDSFLTRPDHTRQYFPSGTLIEQHMRAVPHLSPVQLELDLPQLTLLCGSEFVSSRERKQQLAQYGKLVDMESAAILHVAADHSIPVSILKVVTDGVEAEDHVAEFLTHEKSYTDRLAMAFGHAQQCF
ncbi:MAG: hypothetical protein OXT67_05795 [Zetaproteobacteria bacterium]|nr:hypothetical protein [Zetaproteobacteria bacterium]